ncbi:MAG: nitroreductase family protein [Solirubrobacterales bacterium]
MDNNEFYSAIFKRKSIRKYKKEPLEQNKLEIIQDFIKKLVPLNADIKTEIVILSEEAIKVLLPIKAPHYLTFYSETKEDYLPNAGFMLQQMDLFLSANGIGSCWLGLGVPKKETGSRNGLNFVITMAAGYADEPLYRADVSEFKRNQLREISTLDREELLTAVRVAPSASNTQPWYLSGSADKIVISRKLPNFLKAALYGKFNQIDVGIAMCHLKISAEHMGKTLIFSKENVEMPKGYEYNFTASLI